MCRPRRRQQQQQRGRRRTTTRSWPGPALGTRPATTRSAAAGLAASAAHTAAGASAGDLPANAPLLRPRGAAAAAPAAAPPPPGACGRAWAARRPETLRASSRQTCEVAPGGGKLWGGRPIEQADLQKSIGLALERQGAGCRHDPRAEPNPAQRSTTTQAPNKPPPALSKLPTGSWPS